jgi:hypothetical protein
VIEVIAVEIPNIQYGNSVDVEINEDEIKVEGQETS